MDETDCIFCGIVDGRSPANIFFQDQDLTVFYDRNPIAPVHLLIIPNKHINSLEGIEPSDKDLVFKIISTARDVAQRVGINISGYRLIINTGPDAGQSVFHFHIHLLGGERLSFPIQIH